MTTFDALALLRTLLASLVERLEVWTSLHKVIENLGLPALEANEGKSKFLRRVLSEATDEQVLQATERVLSGWPGQRVPPDERDQAMLEDALWWVRSGGESQIGRVTRTRVAEVLGSTRWSGLATPQELVKSVAPQAGTRSDDFFGELMSPYGAQSSPPADGRYLRSVGLLEWPDPRFIAFVERVVSPEFHVADAQETLVARLQPVLRAGGQSLRPESSEGGLPVYRVRPLRRGTDGPPRFLVFGGTLKPDIVLSDAIQLTPAVQDGDVIAFDEPPPEGDLLWDDLCRWWARKAGFEAEKDARKALGARLLRSLDPGPERLLFETYFKRLRPTYGELLPALLPQVWLHYDPRSARQRGLAPVLFRQRMDFMLLLRHGHSIVLEIDGRQHYADEGGRANTRKYAAQVEEDRRIKLLGYEVFRFGGVEFQNGEDAAEMLHQFFRDLFSRYGVRPPPR